MIEAGVLYRVVIMAFLLGKTTAEAEESKAANAPDMLGQHVPNRGHSMKSWKLEVVGMFKEELRDQYGQSSGGKGTGMVHEVEMAEGPWYGILQSMVRIFHSIQRQVLKQILSFIEGEWHDLIWFVFCEKSPLWEYRRRKGRGTQVEAERTVGSCCSSLNERWSWLRWAASRVGGDQGILILVWRFHPRGLLIGVQQVRMRGQTTGQWCLVPKQEGFFITGENVVGGREPRFVPRCGSLSSC